MKVAGITDYKSFAQDILTYIKDKPISFEVFFDEFDEMERQALEIASWAENIYVKIPITNTKAESSVDLIDTLSSDASSPYLDSAINTLNVITSIAPKYYKAYETLGVIFLESVNVNYSNYDLALENLLLASKLKPDSHILKCRLAQLHNIQAEEYKLEQKYNKMEKKSIEAKKYARQSIKLRKTYGGAHYELAISELNLCNKSSALKSLEKAAKYDRLYRSEVKKIIKRIKPITRHCQ